MSEGTFCLESGVAHDAFHVTLPAGDPRPDEERVAELASKVQALQGAPPRSRAYVGMLLSSGAAIMGDVASRDAGFVRGGGGDAHSFGCTTTVGPLGERPAPIATLAPLIRSPAHRRAQPPKCDPATRCCWWPPTDFRACRV